MKKKIFTVLLSVLLLCAPLAGCSDVFTAQEVEGKQDTTYAVTSNGGSAVQYGNYVYYINGYRGYSDASVENRWGNVVKGGLYRAELTGGKDADLYYTDAFGVTSTLKTYKSGFVVSTVDPDVSYNFVTKVEDIVTGYEKNEKDEIVYDEDGDPIEIVEKQDTVVSYRIASKTIGTSGYADGGIFIFGEYVYYASPSNEQDKNGDVEVDKTSFYRSRLDGQETVRLYTSVNETAETEYAFYCQNGKVYLVVHDGSDIVSVTISEKSKKVSSVKTIAEDVTSVLFPVRDVYYKGIDTNQVEDFIYYTRDITEDDAVRSGNVAVVMRPSGEEASTFLSFGSEVSLVGADGGYLFYKESLASGDVVKYTNMHSVFMTGSETYKKAYEARLSELKGIYGENNIMLGQQSGEALDIEDIADYTTIVCIRPDKRSNQVYAICASAEKIAYYDGTQLITLYSGTVGDIYAVNDGYIYFGDGESACMRANVFASEDDNSVYVVYEGMSEDVTFDFDLMGDFAVVFGEIDDYAADYAWFINVDQLGRNPQFVGVKTDADKYDPSVELLEKED